MTVVIGTAGHIDHGKTALLRALTGIDADRLPEERRRGMTIDVGYAYLRLPDGTELDFVDVPGHDRLVGNMLVGAGEIDAALLVVAADDGPRAQTLEHLELLDALGICHGIAAVTKVDLAGPGRTAEVVEAVRRLLARTSLAGAPVVAVASPAGEGIDGLRSGLIELRDRVAGTRSPVAPPDSPVRLAVDRVFSVRGRGLVVTGSLRGGRLERGASLRLEPAGRNVRARELQVHGATVQALEGGGRIALNLANVEAGELTRGSVLTTDPAVRVTERVLALLKPPARLDDRIGRPGWPLEPGRTYRLHLATDSVDASVRRGRRDGAALPDGRRVATLALARPIAAADGDRFVLRAASLGATAAGGLVLDVAPPIGPSRRRVSAESLAALATAIDAGDAAAALAVRVTLHGVVACGPEGTVAGARTIGAWLLDERVAGGLDAEAEVAVESYHAAQPLAPGVPLAGLRRTLSRSLRRQATVTDRVAASVVAGILDGLVDAGRLVRAGDAVRDPRRSSGGLPPDILAAMDRLERSLAIPAPPPLGDAARLARCPAEGVRALEASGRIVRLEPDLAWATSTYRELESLALRLATPGPLAPATLRNATGTSRKYVMALLEDLDRRGLLRRTPDGQVRGPRARP